MNNALFESSSEFVAAGLRVFPLYRVIDGNRCECGNKNCKAVGKHPARLDWVNQPLVDESTLEIWLDGEFKAPLHGLGWALDASHIVIDVDPRNGGTEAIEALHLDIGISLFDISNAVVKTGGGGWHFYFLKPDGEELAWKMPEKYKGIDIKQGGGYVVIAGSLHGSGNLYEWYSASKSSVDELTVLPEALGKMLARPKVTATESSSNDVALVEIEKMLSYLSPDMGNDEWVRVGMSVYRGTDGSSAGFAAWDSWSKGSDKYNAGEMAGRWHSFGKRRGGSIGISTLIYLAKEAGYHPPVVDDLDACFTEEEMNFINNFGNWGVKSESTKQPMRQKVTDVEDIDPMQLFGPISELLQYIRDKSVYDNKNLALAACLSVASNTIGRRYYLKGRWSNVTPNLILLVVAASATGKESCMGVTRELLKTAGVGKACHGRIKSDKDLMDALAANQYANYLIDEFGIFLGRVSNAKNSGAHYLEGVIGTIMEVYTKANSVLLTDISRREAIISYLAGEVTRLKKECEDYGGSKTAEGEVFFNSAKYLVERLKGVEENGGISNPWLSMFTTATPSTMKDAFTRETVESGFLSRALIFSESETNPKPKIVYNPPSQLPHSPFTRLTACSFMLMRENESMTAGRVDDCFKEEGRDAIKLTDEAADFLGRLEAYLFEWADALKEKGMTPLARRAAEMVVKLCITIAAFNGTDVTLEVIRYATKIVLDDLDKKIMRVEIASNSSSEDGSDRRRALMLKIIDVCQVFASGAEIADRCRSKNISKADISKMILSMVDDGILRQQLSEASGRGRPQKRFIVTDKAKEVMQS